MSDDVIEFIKQSPSYPRDRLALRSKQSEAKFLKEIATQPRESLSSEVKRSKRLAKKQKRRGIVIMPTDALLAAGKIKRKYCNKREKTKKLLRHEKRLENVARKPEDPERVKKLDLWIRNNIKRELING